MMYSTYSEYLALPEFAAVKAEVMERASGNCEVCGDAATEVHHLRYCRWGEIDRPSDLIAICNPCHEDKHRCSVCGLVRLKARHIKRLLTICDECQ